MPKNKEKICEGWIIKCWFKGIKRGVCIDTSDMDDDVAQGIDDYIHNKYEVDESMERRDELL